MDRVEGKVLGGLGRFGAIVVDKRGERAGTASIQLPSGVLTRTKAKDTFGSDTKGALRFVVIRSG